MMMMASLRPRKIMEKRPLCMHVYVIIIDYVSYVKKKGGLLRVSVSENSLCKNTNGSVQAEFRVIYLCRDCEALQRPEMI